MLPNLLIASHSTKTTKALEVSTNSQPVFVIVQVRELPETSASEAVLTNPQTRNATAIAAVTPKTTLSRPERSGSAALDVDVECGVRDHVVHGDRSALTTRRLLRGGGTSRSESDFASAVVTVCRL